MWSVSESENRMLIKPSPPMMIKPFCPRQDAQPQWPPDIQQSMLFSQQTIGLRSMDESWNDYRVWPINSSVSNQSITSDTCQSSPSPPQYVLKPSPVDSRPRRGDRLPTSTGRLSCSFCKKNGELRWYYESHPIRDHTGAVVCPILRSYVCPKCGCTGDQAHTISYCQDCPNQSMSLCRMNLRRQANGKLKRSQFK